MESFSEDSNSPESRNEKIIRDKNFGELFESGLFSDFTVAAYSEDVLKEKEVHRNILCSQTEHFKGMLLNDCEESRSGRVVIKDFQFNVVNEVLRFIYTTKVENLKDMAFDLMDLADMVSMI